MAFQVKIVPAISTIQEMLDYMGIDATTAATNTQSGVITLQAYLTRLMNAAAWEIANFLDRDYTTSQVFTLDFVGDNVTTYIDLPADPAATITYFAAWNLIDGSAVTGLSTADLVLTDSNVGNQIYWTNGPFMAQVQYFIQYQRGTFNTQNVSGWPEPIKQVQQQLVALAYRESANGRETLGFETMHLNGQMKGSTEKLKEPDWRMRLRAYRNMQI